MKTIFVKNYEEMSEKGYEIIKDVIETKEQPVISMTTGGSPRGLFTLLVEGVNNGLDISNTVMMNLDEYIGEECRLYSKHLYV